MGAFTIGLKQIYGGVKTMFGRSSIKAVSTLAETKPARMTKVYTDSATGVTTMEREFLTQTKDGQDYYKLFKVESEVLEDGTKVTRTHVWGRSPNTEYHFGFGGDAIDRTKKIATKDSILGGKQVTINKKYEDTFAMSGRNENLVKEYDADGQLWHKEIDYSNTNGYQVKATQDRVYDEYPLTSSATDMYEEPVKHPNYKHTLAKKRPNEKFFGMEHSNHGNFRVQGSKYADAIQAKEAAKIAETEAKAEAEKAAKLAAEKAAAELAKKRPRINVGKVLNGFNIDELKVIEKVQPNGGVKRYYFKPETGPGNRKPVIVTYDHGSLHKEWIHNGKEDIIYMKQVGDDKPYIYMQKGNYKQISTVDKDGYTVNQQFFTDGKNKYYRNGREHNYYFEGEMENPYYGKEYCETGDQKIVKYTSHHRHTSGELRPPVLPKGYYCIDDFQVGGQEIRNMKNVKQAAEENYVDLADLFAPYKKEV